MTKTTQTEKRKDPPSGAASSSTGARRKAEHEPGDPSESLDFETEDKEWLPKIKKDFPYLSIEPISSVNGKECAGRNRNYSFKTAYEVQFQVCKLRKEKGVGSPDQLHHAPNEEKPKSLSDYTITIEGVFGPDGALVQSEDDIDEELERRDDLKMYAWTGAMGRYCVDGQIYYSMAADEPRFEISSDTPSDDYAFEHLRIYISSPSGATYKLFEFDRIKMTCTNTDVWCGSSSWTTAYNEYKSWKLPYPYKEPKGIELQVALTIGGSHHKKMLGIEWSSGSEQLDEEQVLAYLNGDKVLMEE